MIDASIALLKCVIDYGLCIWAFSWFAKRKSENRALFLGSIFLSSLFLFGINMLEIPWLNTIVSAFTLLVLFLVVFYGRQSDTNNRCRKQKFCTENQNRRGNFVWRVILKQILRL